MGGPPPEMTITLCNITAPKLERWKGNDRYVKLYIHVYGTIAYKDFNYFLILGLYIYIYKIKDLRYKFIT